MFETSKEPYFIQNLEIRDIELGLFSQSLNWGKLNSIGIWSTLIELFDVDVDVDVEIDYGWHTWKVTLLEGKNFLGELRFLS